MMNFVIVSSVGIKRVDCTQILVPLSLRFKFEIMSQLYRLIASALFTPTLTTMTNFVFNDTVLTLLFGKTVLSKQCKS